MLFVSVAPSGHVFSALDAFGTVGLLLLLGAFAANALGRLAASSRVYQGMNALGGAVLAVYAFATRAWVFLPLEVVWAAVATFTLVRPKAAT